MAECSELVCRMTEESCALNDAFRKIEAELSNVKEISREVEKNHKVTVTDHEYELECMKKDKEVLEKKFQSSLNIHDDEVANYQRQLQEIECKNAIENDKLQNELNDSKQQIEILRYENENLLSMVNKKSNKKLKVLQEKLDVTSIENTELNRKLLDKVNMVNFLYERIKNVDELIMNQRKVTEKHQAQSNYLKEKAVQMKQKLGQEMECLKRKNEELEQENKRLSDKVEAYGRKLQTQEEGKNKLHYNNKEQMEMLNRTIQKLEHENKSLDELLQKAERKYKNILLLPGKHEVEQENQELKHQLEEVFEATDNVQAIIKIELNAYERKVEELEHLLNEERKKHKDIPEDEPLLEKK